MHYLIVCNGILFRLLFFSVLSIYGNITLFTFTTESYRSIAEALIFFFFFLLNFLLYISSEGLLEDNISLFNKANKIVNSNSFSAKQNVSFKLLF